MSILILAHLVAFNFAVSVGNMSYQICKKHKFVDGIYKKKLTWDDREVVIRLEPLSCSQWKQLMPNKKYSGCIGGYRCE